MHKKYSDKFFNEPISYEAYRQILIKDVNISFVYPRSDICSACDEHIVNLKSLQKKLTSTVDNKTQFELQSEMEIPEN